MHIQADARQLGAHRAQQQQRQAAGLQPSRLLIAGPRICWSLRCRVRCVAVRCRALPCAAVRCITCKAVCGCQGCGGEVLERFVHCIGMVTGVSLPVRFTESVPGHRAEPHTALHKSLFLSQSTITSFLLCSPVLLNVTHNLDHYRGAVRTWRAEHPPGARGSPNLDGCFVRHARRISQQESVQLEDHRAGS